jgi:RNA polymerase sigma-70 factor (ECF subfamily)
MPTAPIPVPPEVESFGLLVREHQAGLRAFIRMLGADAAAVDDLAQEVFLVAWRRLGDFEAGTDFGKWLRGIARHLVTNERRKEARRARLLPFAVTDLLVHQADSDPAESVDVRRLVSAMEECVAQLPLRHREILQRRYASSENATDLASELRMRADTLRQTLLRIRVVVKECIQRKTVEGRA